jgi:hypothetical protein
MKVEKDISRIGAMVDEFHERMGSLERPRPYLGVSLLGHNCDRYLWLIFRWVVREQFSGRMLRLFRRGQDEERSIVRDLICAGLSMEFTGENQCTVDFGCFIKGHPDGIALGVPEAPKTPHIVEMKTHNKKSFDELENNGVQKSKPRHYDQMQVYMLGRNLNRALYYSVCKDDDRIHSERVRLDKDHAERLVRRGKTIALQETIPAPLSADPSWYECKWCPCYSFCHQTNQMSADNISCRSCALSTPKENGTFYCEKFCGEIPLDTQYDGCASHVLHPDLVPWKLVREKCTEWTAAYEIGEMVIMNGEEGVPTQAILENQGGAR